VQCGGDVEEWGDGLPIQARIFKKAGRIFFSKCL
jgi:hypothetical protein